MKRLGGLLLMGLACLSLSACDSSPVEKGSGSAFKELSFKDALAEAGKQNKVVMIDFGATWCGPCKTMEKTTFRDPEVLKFLRERTIAIKVDVDQNQSLAGKFGVTSVPRMVFVDAQGNELGKIVGAQPPSEFLALATTYAK